MRADRDPVEDDDAGSEPHVVADADAALGERRLEHDGLRDVGEAVVPASHEVAVPGQEAVLAERDLGLGEQCAVGRDVRVVAEPDGSFLAAQDRVPADVGVLADADAVVLLALGVEDREVVDDGAGADADLMRVAEGQVPAEDDSFPHFTQQGGIERLPQRVAERPRERRRARSETRISGRRSVRAGPRRYPCTCRRGTSARRRAPSECSRKRPWPWSPHSARVQYVMDSYTTELALPYFIQHSQGFSTRASFLHQVE